jgi:hypothetical protein
MREDMHAVWLRGSGSWGTGRDGSSRWNAVSDSGIEEVWHDAHNREWPDRAVSSSLSSSGTRQGRGRPITTVIESMANMVAVAYLQGTAR